MNLRDVAVVCLVAVPVGVAIGYGASWLWDRVDDITWPRRTDR